MSVTVRPATSADVPAVAKIWRDGWHDAHLGHVPDGLVEVRTDESFATRAAEQVGETVVAVVGGVLAGFVMVIADEVEQVYVSADHRGAGVAAVLLTAAEQVVVRNGHGKAWLAVVEGNTRARRFYERQGWIDEGPFDHHAPSADGLILVPAHRYVKVVSNA
ncbi:Ribosomal protein S18 acetylase RimI [Amycolatopsis xylanica]|uniref:Ribosomal protein S18 acetylase RimI n=1 Tax=Amycolatopsis xylanica TaxID=589385 RepID=A0A1H3B264_9PSEU|nr:GNAT family N-acetyltransferase [Amycolatopsis xylanica]SDX36017.1 Ribosomal protein S18 acetylase RimI [Amycolatopsis xylanica]